MKHIFIVDPSLKKTFCFGKTIEQLNHSDYKVFYEIDREKIKNITYSLFGTPYILYSVGGDNILNSIVNALEYMVPIHVIPFGISNKFYESHNDIKNTMLLDVGVLNGCEKFIYSAYADFNEKLFTKIRNNKNLFDLIKLKYYLLTNKIDFQKLQIDDNLKDIAAISIYLRSDYDKNSKFWRNNYFNIYQLEQHLNINDKLRLNDYFSYYNSDSFSIKSELPIIFKLDGIEMKNTIFEFDIIERDLKITNNIPDNVKKIIKKIK